MSICRQSNRSIFFFFSVSSRVPSPVVTQLPTTYTTRIINVTFSVLPSAEKFQCLLLLIYTLSLFTLVNQSTKPVALFFCTRSMSMCVILKYLCETLSLAQQANGISQRPRKKMHLFPAKINAHFGRLSELDFCQ